MTVISLNFSDSKLSFMFQCKAVMFTLTHERSRLDCDYMFTITFCFIHKINPTQLTFVYSFYLALSHSSNGLSTCSYTESVIVAKGHQLYKWN